VGTWIENGTGSKSDYRPVYWDYAASADPADQQIVKAMKGKRMPQIGKVIVNVILEDQSRLLAFQKDEVDLFQLYGGLAPQVMKTAS
jgi:ABC-type transport system substrate-binding protein